MSILEVSNVSKSFGGVKANVDISMNVEKGRIVGLIGPQRVPLPPKIAIKTMKTPISLPSKATSVESIYPTKPPMIPPARPQKKADIIQPTILYYMV